MVAGTWSTDITTGNEAEEYRWHYWGLIVFSASEEVPETQRRAPRRLVMTWERRLGQWSLVGKRHSCLRVTPEEDIRAEYHAMIRDLGGPGRPAEFNGDRRRAIFTMYRRRRAEA